jgi:hypothetical protein
MKVSVDIIKVGPKEAEELLSSQVKEQRPLRDSHVKTLSQDMGAGNFRLSADALVVVKGHLANGQHRLWAVIESETKQEFLLMKTDDEDLYKVLDCGIKRSIGDAAYVSNGTSVTAIANLVMGYLDGRLTQFGYTKKVSRIDTVNFVQDNNDALQDSHTFVKSLAAKAAAVAPASASGALLVIASPVHGEKVKEFMQQVYLGSQPGTISYDLRERLIRMRMSKGHMASQYYLALFIKAFNLYLSGGRTTQFKMAESESYPQVSRKAATPPK